MSAVLDRPDFAAFIHAKEHEGADHGFEPTFVPSQAFDFQESLLRFQIRKGRSACFADCGMGKSLIEAAWAENVARHTGKPVLVLAPLAVTAPLACEAEKFGVEAVRSRDGSVHRVTVANYEKLHLFDPSDFAGVVCDESSILKSFDGARQGEITRFMRKVPYRLLATATAAPNDYIELGTSSEALGYLGAMDLLNRYFKNDLNNSATKRMYGEAPKWRFKGHAETPFWRYVASWARACRKPSDLGFADGGFVLPPLVENEVSVEVDSVPDGFLINLPSLTLPGQREEGKRTLRERCEAAAALVADTGKPAALWCHTNDEAATLRQMLPEAVEVSGSDSDERKEAKFRAFESGEARLLITKPKIGAWGLNWQHCAHVVYFPSHSFEQYYQAVRRCWRFGQKNPVVVDIPLTEGQRAIMANMRRKAEQAERMFAELVRHMNDDRYSRAARLPQDFQVPQWL